MKNFKLFKLLALFVVLITSINSAWAWWFVPGEIHGAGWSGTEASSGGFNQMDGSNKITFYNVPAGTYKFKLIKGETWGNGNYVNNSSTYITSICTNCDGGNDKIVIKSACDLTFEITNQDTWWCNVSATAPTYYIKYNWNNAGWGWSGALTSNGGNMYSCTGQYGGSDSYDHTRLSSTDQDGTNTTATVNNSPSTGDKCVFSYNASTNALTITRCNVVTATNHVYFNNSTSNFSDNIYFVVGHDLPTAYSSVYTMTRVAGTNYYHASVGDSWSDATYYAVIASSSSKATIEGDHKWGSSSLSSKGTSGYTAAYTSKYDLAGSNKVYTITTATSGNNKAMTITYQSAGIGFFNKAQTLHLMFSNNGGSTYSDLTTTASAWHGTITAERKYLDSDFGTVVDHTGASKETLSSSAYAKDAIIGSNYVLAESSTATGYTFAGWGNTSSATPDGNSSKTISSVSAANNIYAFFKANQYTITLKRNDATDNSDTQTATYGETAASRAGSLPTRSGYGFDGYWTSASGGTKVINKNGTWVSNVSGYTDSNGKWICTEAKTLHAHWLEEGYYMVGAFTGGDWNAIAANKFDNTTKKCTINVANHDDYSAAGWTSEFKICYVQANTVSAVNETLYGKNPQATIGKYNTSVSSLTSGSVPAILEELSYDGDYIFTLTTSPLGVSVQVPVVDQLQIYNSDPSGATGIANHNWGAPVSNIVSKTVTLAHNTTYQFKAVYDSEHYGYGTGGTYANLGRNTDSTQLATNTNNVKLTTDVKGDYQFDFNIKTKKIKVTYPTRRLVTYSISTIGSGTGTASTLTATNVDDSNVNISTLSNYVANGDRVTFTAPAAKSGYTWKGWYSVEDPSADYNQNKLSVDDNNYFTATISEDYTAYAVYAEDKHSVTVNKTSGGTISVTSVNNIGIATTGAVTAEANEGYYFVGWTLDDGVTQASLTNDNVTSTITINATADSKTITANFAVRYAIYGSFASEDTGDGMPGWTTPRAFDSYDSENKKYTLNLTALKPNSRYKLKVLDRRNGNSYGPTGNSDISDGTQWTLNGTINTGYALYFSTKGCGTYTLTTTTVASGVDEGKPTAKIDMPASYTVTYGQVTNNGQNGGSISSVKDDGNYDLSSGGYVAAAGSATFTAGTPTTGYRFVDWRTSSTYGQGTQLSTDNPWTLSSPDGNKTVYAHYAENMCTVTITANDKTKGSITVAGEAFSWDGTTSVGVYSTKALVVTPVAGYYFSGWTLSTSPDFAVGDATEDGASTTLRGLGGTNGSTGTLTANFVELDKVYFRNWNEGTKAKLMPNVYVYFDITWNNETPTKAVTSSRNSDDHLYAQMTEISNNIYWAYVPRVFTKKSGDEKNIGFADVEMTENSYKFYSGNSSTIAIAATRGDYNRAINMFVPCHTPKKTNANYVDYYDDGYWKNYGLAGEKSGYKILRWDGSKYVNPASKGTGDDYQFVVIDDNTISYELRIDNTTDEHHNRFKIYTVANTSYTTAKGSPSNPGITITTANCNSLIGLKDYETNNNPIFEITPTSDGIYTLIIDQSADTMTIKVDYPLAVGDYKLVHSYTNGSAKISQSDIIKSAELATRTYSMFIDNYSTHSPSLVLKKCTDISDSKPVWSDGTAVSMTGFKSDTAGVFQFKVSVTTDVATISNIAVYDGEYYIKTDIGSGGWTAYKANVMEKNTLTFNKADSKTFDRSYCHWVGSTSTNIKCVIANDYNIAVSDTLEGDAIIGVGNQTLPSAAHVRFSYNSTTNELKRTYLAVSGDDHLILEGNTITSGSTAYLVHNPSTHSKYTDNKATLDNVSNFTFGLDIEACEKARVRLSAKYNSVVQYLIGEAGSVDGATNANTVEIMGGITDLEKYNTLRISYDFKTNQLLSAWLPPTSGDSPDKAINADVMIIREEQGDARQITFAKNTDALSAVDTVYGVMKFNKYSLNNRNKTNTADSVRSAYARDLYWISFPFDVKLSDAFGMGTYGTHWIIERYDGKGRAKNGFWADSEPNWKFVTPYMRDTGFVMKANEGYILALDLVQLGYSSLVWDNNMTEAYLYFPSQSRVGNIKEKTVELEIDTVGYTCTINRGTPDGNRTIKDSHWHCIGAPSFANIDHATGTSWVDENEDGNKDYPNVENWKTNTLLFVYDWNSEYNTLTPVSAASHNFKAMHAYMVQYSQPTISWTSASTPVASVAARLADTPDREYQLALLREDEEQDHTYVRLSDNENVTAGFEFNYDLSKELNKNRGNIWTVTTDGTQVAGNSMPHPLATTIVPVGVKIATAGEYTFSMPEGTNGGDVWLLDNQTNSRTNLGLMDYTVNLTAGTIDGRFSLEFPVQNVVTDIDEMSTVNSQLSTDSVRKVFVGGRLYIIRDGKAYDATGAQVR